MGLSLGLGMLAQTTGVPEIGIDDTEAREIVKAVSKLAAFYDLSASGPAGAWMGLAGTLGPIVGAHYLAYRMRTSAEASAAAQTPAPAQAAFGTPLH